MRITESSCANICASHAVRAVVTIRRRHDSFSLLGIKKRFVQGSASMDHYHTWFDLKPGTKDADFARSMARYMGHLKDNGLIEDWRLTRRKLGFGPPDLGEFHIVMETKDLGAARCCVQSRLHAARAGRNRAFRYQRARPEPEDRALSRFSRSPPSRGRGEVLTVRRAHTAEAAAAANILTEAAA